jgi:hypothetical protein
LKKLKVVVENKTAMPTSTGNFQSNLEAIYFEGENLSAINKGISNCENEPLVIRDDMEVIAVFSVWNYWQKIA